MTLAMHGHQVRQVDGCIDLGGCQRCVAQEFLDGPEVHSRLEKVSSKSVPKGVRMHLVLGRGLEDSSRENSPHGPVSQASPALVEEKGFGGERGALFPLSPDGEVGAQCSCGLGTVGHDTFLASFTSDADETRFELQIGEIQTDQFPDPES